MLDGLASLRRIEDLASDDRLDSCLFRRKIKVNSAKEIMRIRNSDRSHSQTKEPAQTGPQRGLLPGGDCTGYEREDA